MPGYTDDERKKTVAEYLGFTGTPVEILEKAEKEIESYPEGATARRLKDILSYAGYKLDIGRQSKDQALYPYVIRALLFTATKDKEDRLTPPKDSTPARTVGELITDKGAIDDLLKEQEEQISRDYSDSNKGAKFLGHKPKRESMEDIEFFFRFWRSPIKKTFDYLVLGSSPDSMARKREILKTLSGSEINDVDSYLMTTPEYFVEERIELEKANEEELRKAKDKPLFHTFNIKFGTTFPDPVEPDKLDTYASEAQWKNIQEYLQDLLRLDRNNVPDRDTCVHFGAQTENNITADKERYKAEVIHRLDEQWIKANMTRTFGDFITERRKDNAMLSTDPALGPSGTVATVLNILNETAPGATPKPDVDAKTLHMGMGFGKGLVEVLSGMTLTDIKDHREEIRKEYTDTRVKKLWKRGIIIGSTIAALLGTTYLFTNKEKQPDKTSNKAPTEERAQAKAPEKRTAKAPDKAPAPAVQNTPAAASTNMVQKALDQQAATNGVDTVTTTNGVDTAQQPSGPTAVIGKKGNHLIGLRWTGYKDIGRNVVMEDAADLVFKTHFDYMNAKIQETGLPFVDLFKPEYTRRTLQKVHDYVWLKPIGSKDKIKFYIQPGGRVRDEITEDLLSFYMNCRDVLQSLPVATENLPEAQSKVMTALGPSMGWSTKQQIAWQKKHPQETEQAAKTIAELAHAGIKDHQVDTNNLEAVFMETIEAARVYRNTHPGNMALLLNVDDVARVISNVGKEDMARYDKLAPREATEAHKHIVENNEAERAPTVQKSQTPSGMSGASYPAAPQPRREKDSGGFPWKTTAAVGIIAYLWGRKKKRGG